jgi:hypothetical protein
MGVAVCVGNACIFTMGATGTGIATTWDTDALEEESPFPEATATKIMPAIKAKLAMRTISYRRLEVRRS